MSITPRDKLEGYISILRLLKQDFENEIEISRVPRIWKKINPYPLATARRKRKLKSNQEQRFLAQLSQIQNFLHTISVIESNLRSTGNSSRFLKRLAAVEKYSAVETKIRHTIAILTQIREENIIYNSQIDQYLAEKRINNIEQHRAIITKLEQSFRNVITRKLRELSSDWFDTRVPERIRKKAEKAKRHDNNSDDQYKKEISLIDYVEFIDYAEIITGEDNWNAVFKEVFSDKDAIIVKFRELKPIRNAISHSRDLRPRQILKLQLYSDDLINVINKFLNKS